MLPMRSDGSPSGPSASGSLSSPALSLSPMHQPTGRRDWRQEPRRYAITWRYDSGALRAEMAELGLTELPDRQEAEAAEREASRAEAMTADALGPARAALAPLAAERTTLADALARAEANRQAATAEVGRLLREAEHATMQEADSTLAARLLSTGEVVEEQRLLLATLEASRPEDTLAGMDARIRRFEEAISQRRETQQRLQRDKAVLQSRIQQAEGGGIDEQVAIAERRRDDLRHRTRRAATGGGSAGPAARIADRGGAGSQGTISGARRAAHHALSARAIPRRRRARATRISG